MNIRHTLLLVDDSENDLMLMRRAFEKAECDIVLREVRNGEEAIAYLLGEGPYGDRNSFPLPTVMLLDLNMPMKSGLDVLAWVRAHPVLKRLPIVILTASMRTEDLDRAFDLGASAFLVKPGNLTTLISMMRCLCDWLQINRFASLDDVGRQ